MLLISFNTSFYSHVIPIPSFSFSLSLAFSLPFIHIVFIAKSNQLLPLHERSRPLSRQCVYIDMMRSLVVKRKIWIRRKKMWKWILGSINFFNVVSYFSYQFYYQTIKSLLGIKSSNCTKLSLEFYYHMDKERERPWEWEEEKMENENNKAKRRYII